MRILERLSRVVSIMEQGNGTRPSKLTGRAFYESIGSPKMVLAPMVDQSEFVGNSSMSLD